jgi:hypothetical protein
MTTLLLESLPAVRTDCRKVYTCTYAVDTVNCLSKLRVHEENVCETDELGVLWRVTTAEVCTCSTVLRN